MIDYNDSPLMLMTDVVVLLMSDGLYKILTDEEISSVLLNFNDVNEALYALELKVRILSKERNILRDNMTVVTTQKEYTEYRYRDRSLIYTYYHTKTESFESVKEITAADAGTNETIKNIKKWVKYTVH